ncbi:hypothetical protein BGC07_01060 [Piscirickettsia litoralis]|uniref:DUF4402 domain-containing protein n=1 Tax=Piscirickettsia litoralis TaxID=1891921 RepID=A0ABX3A8R5_9GAMM|nr:hypothetical protein BGC07_01060 [Piscirickettsia litoralis]
MTGEPPCKKSAILTAALITLGASYSAFAATGSVSVVAKVFQALTVTQTQAMDFGNLYVTTGSSSTKQATGSFGITGEKGASVSIDYPATITLAGPSSSTLNVTIQTSDENDSLNPGNGRLTKNIVGEVTVDNSTTAGNYSGTATVTVSYV